MGLTEEQIMSMPDDELILQPDPKTEDTKDTKDNEGE